jgi:hypothetical protein
MRRWLSGLLVVVVGGCASSGGDGLMRRGAFVEAEAAYDRELAAAPANAELTQKRTAAREAVVRQKLEQARAVRGSGHGEAALSMLAEALRLEDRWALTLSAETAAARDAEIGAAGETLRSTIGPLLAAKAPLAAGARAEKLYPLLVHARLAPITERTKAEIAAAAKSRCAELSATADSGAPHLGIWIADYCDQLGTPSTPRAAPEQRRGLRVSGVLKHATAAQQQIFETWLAGAFRETAWFAADAPDMTSVEVAGAYRTELERRRVMLSAPYHDTVRSRVTEGLLGPTATVETEADRVFQYEAEQYDARYDLDANLSFDFGDGAPLPVRVKLVTKQRAYEHDVEFARASVHPQRADIPDVNTWLTSILNGKKPAMIRKLRGRWAKDFCGRARYSPEEAAQCLLGRDQPKAALASFETVFGPDAGLLLGDFQRREQEPKPANAADKAKSAPAIEDTGTASGESI